MPTLLTLLLLLVPAPKQPPNPLVGAFAIDWGSIEQTTFLRADGTCWSPEYGAGEWSESDGAIWFGERDNVNQYVMQIDWQTGHGTGWAWNAGELRGMVHVAIRHGERLPMPRMVE